MPNNNGKATNWAKNFGRSVKFSAVEVMKDLAPNTTQTATNMSTSATDIVKTLKELRSNQSRLMNTLGEQVPASKYVKPFLQNAGKDLKSGNFNNQARVAAMAKKENEDMMAGFDDDMSFSSDGPEDGEFAIDGMEELSEGISTVAKTTGQTAIATNQLSVDINKQTGVIAEQIQESTVVSKQIATNTFAMQEAMHKNTMASLEGINSNLGKVIEFNNTTMATYTMGALKYYEDSLTVMKSMLSEIQIGNKHAGAYEKKEEAAPDASQFSQLFTGRGVMKFDKYGSIVKKNFVSTIEEDPVLSTFKEFLTNEDALKMIVANPLGSVSTMIATSLIPITLKRSIQRLDESIGNFFPALFGKIGRSAKNYDNQLLQTLGKIFGLRVEDRSQIDYSKYEKGAVPFDGTVHKAITTVIPKYLSEILSALTGKEAINFDYEKGEFATNRQMAKRIQDDEKNTRLGAYYKQINEMEKMMERMTFQNMKDKKDLRNDIDNLFLTLSREGNDGWNPLKDDMVSGVGSKNAKIIKAMFANMSRGKQLGLAKSTYQSRDAANGRIDKALKDQAMLISMMLTDPKTQAAFKTNSHLKFNNEDDPSNRTIAGKPGPIENSDKYGNTQISLLREIRNTLLEGIMVFPSGGGNGGRSRTSRMRRLLSRRNKIKGADLSNGRIFDTEHADNSGQYDSIDNSSKPEGEYFNASKNLGNMSQADINAQLGLAVDSGNASTPGQGGIFDTVSKNGNGGGIFTKMKKTIENFFSSPLSLLNKTLDDIDRGLYTIIYGSDEEQGADKSIVGATINSIKKTFGTFTEWMKKKYHKIFGDEGITGTKFYKKGKEKVKELAGYLVGKKDKNGVRSGGVLSESFNSLGDIMKEVRYHMFGTAYKDSKGQDIKYNPGSIFGQIKTNISDGFGWMRKYLFGEPKKGKDGKPQSFMDQMYDTLGTGWTNFKNFFFGGSMDAKAGKQEFTEIMTDFKKHMPKAMAYGVIGAGVATFTNFGILGSLFLPGGPIGGALLGTAAGLLGQSEKFKNFLFGPKGADDKRIGGVISKSVQDFFSKHKTAIIGGGMFGAVKGALNSIGAFNLLPGGYMLSMFMPGGIVGGAITGAAVGLAIKSKTFQEFLYGKDDGTGTGKKVGGLFNSKGSKALKKHVPNMLFGALSFGAAGTVLGHMGFMGAMLTPGGPIGMAILGAATGIAISSDKFKKFLFGEDDAKTGVHKSGLFGKISNMIKMGVTEPLKLKLKKISFNVEKWFKFNIGMPFKLALAPFKQQMLIFQREMKHMFVGGWKKLTHFMGDAFTRFIGKPLGQVMEDRILKPLRNLLGGLVNIAGKIVGGVLSAPFKAMNAMADGLQSHQEKRGLKKGQEKARGNLKQSVWNALTGQDNEEGHSVWESLKGVAHAYGGPKTREKEKHGREGAPYARARAKMKADMEKEYGQWAHDKQSALDKESASLKDRQTGAKLANYNNAFLDSKGNVIGDVGVLYDMSKDSSKATQFIIKQTSISAKLHGLVGKILAFMTGDPDFATQETFGLKGLKMDSNGISEDMKKAKVDKEKKESIAKKVEHGTVSENDASKIAAQSVAHGGSAGVVPTTPPTSAKSVVNNAKSQAASITPPDPNKPNFDLQLFAGAAGNSSLKHTLKAMQGFTGKRVSANGSPEYDEKKASEKTTSYQDDVTKYLKIISSNVDGQLNGIGSNVYKTRLAVQEIAGVNDKDVTGSANKDRVSLLGGFRRNMMMMLRHPVEFFGKMITAPFRAIAAVGTKIKNTVLGIATGIKNVVKGAVHGAYEMVKGVGKALLAIPETLASLITGVVEVGKDLVVGALHVVTEGLVGVTSAFFGLVSHSISAIGNILNGLTKGVGALMEGVGLFGKALFEGFGEGLSLAAKTAINIAGGVADVTVGLVHTAGDMATAAMKGIGQVATSVVNGVMDVLGGIVSGAFSLISAPFKLFGGKGNSIRDKVTITGGVIDTVKEVEHVKEIEHVTNVDKVSAVSKVDELGFGKVVTITPETGAAGLAAGAKKLKHFSKFGSGLKAAGSKFKSAFDLQLFGGGAVNQQAPVGENVSADMLASGVSGVSAAGGAVKRTAAFATAVKTALADKLLAKNTAADQLKSVHSIKDDVKAHKNNFSKFFKWLILGGAALMKLLRNLPKLLKGLMNGGLGGLTRAIEEALKKGAENGEKDLVKNGTKLGAKQMRNKIATTLEKLAKRGGKFYGRVLKQAKHLGGYWLDKYNIYETDDMRNARKVAMAKNGELPEGIYDRGGGVLNPEAIGKEAGEAAESAAAGSAEKGGLSAAGRGSRSKALGKAQSLMNKTVNDAISKTAPAEIGKDIGAEMAKNLPSAVERAVAASANNIFPAAVDGSLNGVLNGIEHGAEGIGENGAKDAAELAHDKIANSMKWGNISTTDAFDKMAGRVASDMEKEGAEKAAGDVAAKSIEGFSSDIMDKAVARSEDTLFTKVQKLFVKGLNILEDGVSRVTGKSFKFADSIGGKVLGSFTKDIAVKFAGPLTKAVAKAVAAEASAHLLDAVLLVWNLPTGAMEAAHIFKVNEDRVTTAMRICAAASKAVFGAAFAPLAIIDVVLCILDIFTGSDHVGVFAGMLYEAIADSDAIAELDAAQKDFAAEAESAGETVDQHNDNKNKTVWDTVKEKWQSEKDTLSGMWKNHSAGMMIGGALGSVVPGLGTIVGAHVGGKIGSYLTGDNDENGNYQKGAFARAKDSLDNNEAYLFGQNDENGNYQKGAFAKAKDGLDNNLAYLFGQNDENGDYQAGAFAKAKESIVKGITGIGDGINNNLAYLFGQNDSEGKYQQGALGSGMGKILAGLFGENDENGDYKPGAFAAAKKKIGDAFDVIGDKFNGAVKAVQNFSLDDTLAATVKWLIGGKDSDGNWYDGSLITGYKNLKKSISAAFSAIQNNMDYVSKGIGQWADESDNKADKAAGHSGLYHTFNVIANVFRGLMGLEWDTEALQRGIDTITDNPLFHLIGDFFNGVVNNLGYAGGGIGQYLSGQDSRADQAAGHGPLYRVFNVIANVFRGLMGLEWDTEALQKDINTVTDNPLFHLIADGFNGIVNNLGYAGGGIEQLLNGQDAQADADAGHGGLYHFFNTIANVFRGFMGLEWDSESLGNTIAEITDNKLFHIIADSFGSLGGTFSNWVTNAAGALTTNGPIVGGFVIVQNLLRGLFGLEWDPSPMQTVISSVTTAITGAFSTISSKFDELCKWWADFSIVGTGKSIVTSFLKGIQDKYNNSTFRQSISDAIEHFTGDGSGDRGAAKRKKEKFAGRGSTTSGKDEMGAFNVNLFSGGGAGDTPDTENGFSYYSQNDSTWKGSSYGDESGMGNFGDTGCGPTAMAMVASNITGKAVSPTDMANFSMANGYRVPGGTDEGMFTDAASQMGINSVPLAGKDNIGAALHSGQPVILGGRSSSNAPGNPFTNAGHYTVAVGMDENGKVITNDPRGKQYSQHIDYNKIVNDSVTGYAFSGNGISTSKRKPAAVKHFHGSGKSDATAGSAAYTSGCDAFMGQRMPDGRNGCVEAVVRIGSYYDDFLKGEYDKGVAGVELLASDAGDRYIDFDDSKLEQGDVIVFGDNDHVVTYDGNGGYVGNSSSQEQVVHGSDYHNIGLTPTHIIKTPSGGNGGYSGGNGSSGGKGAKKERTIMDLFGHLGDMYTNFGTSVMGGKLYTKTAWGDEDNGGSGSKGGKGGSGAVSTEVTGQTKKDIWKFLKANGFTDVAAAGLMANMQQESGFDTTAVQDHPEMNAMDPPEYCTEADEGAHAYGLCQWTGSRLRKLVAFAQSKGKPAGDLMTQLEFMITEAKESYGGVIEHINAADDPADAAGVWLSEYEGAGVEGNRREYAQPIYDEFAGSGLGDRFIGSMARNQFRGSGKGDKRRHKFAGSGGGIFGMIKGKLDMYRFMMRNGIHPSVLKTKDGTKTVMDMMHGVKPQGEFDGQNWSARRLVGTKIVKKPLYTGKDTPKSSQRGGVKQSTSSAPNTPSAQVASTVGPSVPTAVASAIASSSAVPSPMGPTHKTSNDVAPYSAATVGNVTQASTATFKGGEYFNDPTKVSSAARGYMSGDADIDTVAKSVGFDNGAPDGTTPLSVEQQQMLGFREYNPTRNWNSYVTSSYMWQHGSGKTSVDSWAGKGSFAGAGSGGFNWGGLLGGLFKVYGAIRLAKEQKKAMAKAHADALAHPKININKDNFAKGATVGGITQAAISTFKGGEYFNDPSKITAEAKAYVATGAGDLATVAKSVGFEDGAPDASAVLTVEQQEMLGFKEFDPNRTWGDYTSKVTIWQGNKMTDAEKWAKSQGFAGSGRGSGGSKWGNILGGLFGIYGAIRAHHEQKKAALAAKLEALKHPKTNFNKDLFKDGAKIGDITQAAISTFKGGEYFNDPSKITAEAKAYVATGAGDLNTVAKSVGFPDGAPDASAELTVEQQEMLGFKEFDPKRTWGDYVSRSKIWQDKKSTDAERWAAQNGGSTPAAGTASPNGPTVPTTTDPGTIAVPTPMDATHKTPNSPIADIVGSTVGGITQSPIGTFTGGEYFNDPSKVTAAAKAFTRGQASLDDVAKSIGFKDGQPDGNTPLTVEQQQMLGFREYAKVRNWNTYVNESYMWQHSHGQTSVESWMNAHNGGFAGSGRGSRGGSKWGGILGGLFGIYGAIRAHHEQKKAALAARLEALKHPKTNFNKDNFAKGATIGGITQAAIGTFKGGEYFNDPSKITAEAKAYVATGAGDLNTVAKSVGFPDGAPDASAILTVEQQEMLGFKEFDPKRTWGDYVSRSKIWQDKKSTDAERWAAQNAGSTPAAGTASPNGPTVPTTTTPGTIAVPTPMDVTHKTPNSPIADIVGSTVGNITQSPIGTFTGGEYFNDPSKVTAEAKAFARGMATLDDVAKSVGFKDGQPDGNTPLTVEQQQMLGFREYAKARNWNAYANESYMWQHSHGQTSVESWMNAHNGGFAGSGNGHKFAGGGFLDTYLKNYLARRGKYRMPGNYNQASLRKDRNTIIGNLFGGRSPTAGLVSGVANTKDLKHPKVEFNKDLFKEGVKIGDMTQAAIGTFKGGEYFNDPSKITAEAKAYAATGAGDLNTVAKSVGFVDGAPDASVELTVEQQEMLGFKEFDPKRTWGDYVSRSKIWQDKKSTDAERWAAQNGFKGSGRGDRFAGGGFFDFFARWFHHKKPVSNGSNAPGSPASKVPSPSDPTHKTANESYSNAAHVGDIVQADISTFKGGEYYNDPSKVTAAAKAFARGQADIDDVAKSVGFANGAPDGTTPLTVEQQQMLGFREYNPTRNWNSYVTASYMWQHSHGQTSVESWMNAHNPGFTGGGVGDYKHSNSGSSSNSVIYTGSGHMAGSGNATEYQRKVSKMSMRGNGTGASGDDKLDKIVELLTAIVNNTGDINGNIGKLGNSKQILDKSGKPIVIPMQQSSDARNDIRNAKGSNGVDTTLYSLGRKIAAGGSFAKQ